MKSEANFAATGSPRRRGLNAAIWLAVFLSPTGFFLLVMFADRRQVPAPPESLVVALMLLIPLAALLACGAMVWRSGLSLRRRAGLLVLTALAMLLQCAAWFVLLVSALNAAIAPAQ